MDSVVVDLGKGVVIGDDFRIVRPLQRGGMGAVYVAEQLSTRRPRALKLMHSARSDDTELRRRFALEARVGALIASEHVVDVIAAGIDEPSGLPFLAMELLEGEDLATYLHGRAPLPPSEVHEILSQVAHALSAAHDIPVVHRDLKPSNVFLATPRVAGGTRLVKVLDFGLAKVLGEHPSTTQAMGSPAWMAPEQAEHDTAVGPSADVWAFGLLAFRLLTGHGYWRAAQAPQASATAILREVMFDPIEPARSRATLYGQGHALPPAFDAWFARAVTRAPDRRFPHLRDAWAELAPLLGAATDRRAAPGDPVASPPLPASQRTLSTVAPAPAGPTDRGLTSGEIAGDRSSLHAVDAPTATRPLGRRGALVSLVALASAGALGAFLLVPTSRRGSSPGTSALAPGTLQTAATPPDGPRPSTPPAPSSASLGPTASAPPIAPDAGPRDPVRPTEASPPARSPRGTLPGPSQAPRSPVGDATGPGSAPPAPASARGPAPTSTPAASTPPYAPFLL